MIVLKKSDQEEKFSSEKLVHSILSANVDTNETLDVELLMAEFQALTMDKDFVTTGQINVLIYGLLYAKEATKTLENYTKFKQYK